MSDATHLWFEKNTEILFGCGVGSFGSGTKGLDFLMAVDSPEDLVDEPGEFVDGHVLAESVVVDPVWAITGVL